MLAADWPAIGTAAAAALRSGVDPLDADAVDVALSGRLDDDARTWALTLFCDPIGVTAPDTYVNGRHRSASLQSTGSAIAVISSNAAEAAAERRLAATPRPIVSWP